MKTKKNYFLIDGVNEEFETLNDAKHHIYIAYTPKERVKDLSGSSILHIINDEEASYTPIYVKKDGSYSFGRTIKCPW